MPIVNDLPCAAVASGVSAGADVCAAGTAELSAFAIEFCDVVPAHPANAMATSIIATISKPNLLTVLFMFFSLKYLKIIFKHQT
jgi:hypothetical protein